jgi:hypothetical protein
VWNPVLVYNDLEICTSYWSLGYTFILFLYPAHLLIAAGIYLQTYRMLGFFFMCCGELIMLCLSFFFFVEKNYLQFLTNLSLFCQCTGCSALCILCPKWILQIWSCMQIWSPNGYTRLQFICFTPIWRANCSLSSRFLCCHFGSIFIFPRIYFNQRPINESSSITSGSTRACWSSLAKGGLPSRYHYANSDFFYRRRQFKPGWWSLIFLSWVEWSSRHNFSVTLTQVG